MSTCSGSHSFAHLIKVIIDFVFFLQGMGPGTVHQKRPHVGPLDQWPGWEDGGGRFGWGCVVWMDLGSWVGLGGLGWVGWGWRLGEVVSFGLRLEVG